jgi:hypothetical protein
MCSAANEIIELFLKKRAIDLERGIREMLAPGTASGTNDIVQKLYDHALINNLFGNRYEDSRIASKLRYLWRTHLPSYIPARSFALALMDLLTTSARAAAAPPAAPGTPGAPPPVDPPSSGATGSTPPGNFEVKLSQPPPPPLAPGVTNNPLTPLRGAIATSPLLDPVAPLMPDVRQGLIALVDAAGDDVAKARENIETWFNNSMDRVSSWYKRRTQVVILILGFVIAVATNADSITIAKKLSTDETLRESLVAAAQEYSKTHAAPTPTPDTSKQTNTESTKPGAGSTAPGANPAPTQSPSPVPTPTPCPSPAPTPPVIPAACKDLNSAECKKDLPAAIAECSEVNSAACKAKLDFVKECFKDPKSQACNQGRILLTIPECVADKDSPTCKEKAFYRSIPACSECKPGTDPKESPQCKLEANRRRLEALNLPIGWGSVDDVSRKWPGSNVFDPGGWLDQAQWHLFGWLLTALAISLGAPFWFDLLNKFIVIRSAVKPHEKSPEEESKD